MARAQSNPLITTSDPILGYIPVDFTGWSAANCGGLSAVTWAPLTDRLTPDGRLFTTSPSGKYWATYTVDGLSMSLDKDVAAASVRSGLYTCTGAFYHAASGKVIFKDVNNATSGPYYAGTYDPSTCGTVGATAASFNSSTVIYDSGSGQTNTNRILPMKGGNWIVANPRNYYGTDPYYLRPEYIQTNDAATSEVSYNYVSVTAYDNNEYNLSLIRLSETKAVLTYPYMSATGTWAKGVVWDDGSFGTTQSNYYDYLVMGSAFQSWNGSLYFAISSTLIGTFSSTTGNYLSIADVNGSSIGYRCSPTYTASPLGNGYTTMGIRLSENTFFALAWPTAGGTVYGCVMTFNTSNNTITTGSWQSLGSVSATGTTHGYPVAINLPGNKVFLWFKCANSSYYIILKGAA
jgi:hypothetical protein